MITNFFYLLRRIREYLKKRADIHLLQSSDLFNKDWYLANNPDVANAKVDAVSHYLLYGGFEGRDPGPNFSNKWYLDTYEDVKRDGVNPLVHYLRYTRKEKLFESDIIATENQSFMTTISSIASGIRQPVMVTYRNVFSGIKSNVISNAEKSWIVIKFASFLAERSGSSKVVVITDIESLDLDCIYPKDAIVIMPNAISSLERSAQLRKLLKKMLENVQKVFLFENINMVPDAEKLEAFLKSQGLPVEFVGYINKQNKKVETLVIISSSHALRQLPPPVNFKIIAVISSYNEEDVIVPVIEQLYHDGVDVYLIDNWSTDETYERAKSLMGKGLIGLEKFPTDGPSSTHNWKDLLKRKEELCEELDADWFIHHDADDFRESPWKGICLRDAIYRVDQQGYNAINFTVLNFFPIDNNYQPGTSLIDYFKHFEFGKHPAYAKQTQAWKKTIDRVNLHESGGHSVEFSDRKIYPYNFLLRHYPIRSQSHGERKIFRDRKPRYNPIAKKEGWHNHYDIYIPGSNFIKNPEELIEFRSNFYTEYFIERLSGIGIIFP